MSEKPLIEMLNEYLVWLDDEDGDSPFPHWMGETGWVEHDDGSSEDWGQYLLRLSATEVAQLDAENERLQQLDSSYGHLYLVAMRIIKDEHGDEMYWDLFDKVAEHFDALLAGKD